MYHVDDEKSTEHMHEFIRLSERKNCFNRVKELVKIGLNKAKEELFYRRIAISKMLEEEAREYEKEFAQQVKQRLEENLGVQDRPRIEEMQRLRAAEKRNLLERKNVQRSFVNCHEMRKALRSLELHRLKESHLEQMVEKERQCRRECEQNKAWHIAEQRLQKKYEEEERQAAELRKKIMLKNRLMKEEQLHEAHERKEKIRQLEAQEREYYANRAREAAMEEEVNKPKNLEYGQELRAAIELNAMQKRTRGAQQLLQERRELDDLEFAELEEKRLGQIRKRDKFKENISYLQYLRRMKKFEDDQDKMRTSRVLDLHHVDYCTKINLAEKARKRAEEALRLQEELRRQIDTQQARRLYEEVERREYKMIENPFARDEKSKEKLREQQRKLREELDKQIHELQAERARDKAVDENLRKMKQQESDKCIELAQKYTAAGYSFLEPHPNWRILAPNAKVSCENYVRKDDVPKQLQMLKDVASEHDHNHNHNHNFFCMTGASPAIHCPRFPSKFSNKPPSTCIDHKNLTKMYEMCK